MKKIIITIAFALAMISCEKNSEQIKVVKTDLKSDPKFTKEEFEATKFSTAEMIGKDARSEIVSTYFKRKRGAFASALDVFDENTLPTNQKTFKVEAFRISNDTTFKKIYYLNEKNEIISKFWLK